MPIWFEAFVCLPQVALAQPNLPPVMRLLILCLISMLSADLRAQNQQGSAVAPGVAVSGSRLTAGEAQALVDYHNRVRKEVGVGAVTWSPEIAAFAQQWADELARRGAFEHRPARQQKYGENLAGGTTGAFTVLTGASMWYGEKKLYRAGAPFSATFLPAGHYTQMVWTTSNRIGAGMAICKTGKYRGWTILVCNYAERGNVVGKKPY